MSVPSMVHRSGDTLVVRSVVSGDALFGSEEEEDCTTDKSNEPTEKDLPECKVKRNYSCSSCDFFTQNPRSYLYHLRDVHNEKVRIYECPSCLYASKHFQKLIRHTRMVHGSADGEIQNRKGKKRPLLQTPEDLEESNESPTSADESQPGPHIDDEETPAEKSGLKCSVCTFVAKNHAQLNKHERDEHIKTKFFRCAKCTYVTHMKARFTKHVKYHSMPMIKCDMCDFRTPYKWNLDRHCKNHNGKGTFRCSACNFTADIKQSLTVHEMNHHVPPVGQAAGLGVGRRRNKVGASDSTAAEDVVVSQVQSEPEQCETAPSGKSKLKIPAKKPKGANQDFSIGGGSDFVHPDDIVQHANGNVYIKTKCRFCNFKTAWDGEMARHEERTHAHLLSPGKKKPPRPVPNLIPISPPKQSKTEPAMSQKDMNEICARSQNSALKDFASLFNSEEIFPKENSGSGKSPKKNPSIFEKMKEQISGDPEDLLTCRLCGHESKCLSESCAHKKTCGKESAPSLNITTIHTLSSTRCQYCRQRCKSSKDLLQHLQTCTLAVKYFEQESETADDDNDQLHIVTEEDNSRGSEKDHPHPMENKVFVWNKIVPMDTSADEPSFDYVEDKAEDNVSLDLSTRTQSPCSEASNLEVMHPVISTPTPTPTITTDKIPTHGNDISIAQHKRVFKCPHCTFWASTASRFHVHIVGHLNKKPFECSLCAYRSNWRWDITKHIKLKSVRDPAHEAAKVLMTDETGRRNYTKYNKYLTEIPLPGGVDNHETSGGNGTRPRQQQHHQGDLPKAGKNPGSTEFSTLLSKVSTNKPLPALKTADEFFNKVDKKRPQNDKKTLWQCKKCNFRDPCKDKLLLHVKGHVNASPQSSQQQQQQQHQQTSQLLSQSLAGCSGTASSSSSPSSSSLAGIGNQRFATSSGPAGIGDDLDTEASVGGSGMARGQAPFRCGHCHQVSNWKHVIQRHCRLKHSGDIKVIVASKTFDKIETDSFSDDLPEHSDVLQEGQFKCRHCPFASDDAEEYQTHADGHGANTPLKCFFCGFSVSTKDDLYQHIRLHGVLNYNEYIQKLDKQLLIGDVETSKRHKCSVCPYVTNSKSQFSYHKQFHQQKNGQYRCTMCSYNVSKRHLLHQHMKVHGISISPQKQNGETIDLEDMSEEIEEIQPQSIDWQSLHEIPLVWVSKSGKLSKMYKCRYCPHVNLRKVNIQEHEKMHGLREKSVSRGNETEHRCPECNYVCNNAGVLSSHSKVHQGLYGTVHGIVDTAKTDEEQIRELGNLLNTPHILETVEMDEEESKQNENNDTLHFCHKCPARFIRESEYKFHINLHGARLNYCCDYCSYSAKQKQHLLAHVKVHNKEYLERTKALLESCIVRPEYPPPDLTYLPKSGVWVVDESFELVSPVQSSRSRMSVPLSGTELFQQKSEAEANECAQNYFKDAGKFDFTRNGRDDELRRYKCPKCANSFESYEMCKRHTELHNFKTVFKEEIKEEVRTSDDESIPEDMSMPRTIKESSPPEAKKPYWCQKCPYNNQRRDSVENHQKRHIEISGVANSHTCQHCDYSVPQNHFLREHNKLHFVPQNKPRTHPDAYMSCDSMRLSTKILLKEEKEDNSQEDDDEEEEGMDFSNKEEDLGCGLVEGDNNNESEKVYVNVKSGEVLDADVTMEAAS